MGTTRSDATRKTGLVAWSAAALVTVLAAVSACSASGSPADQLQPEPTSRVERNVEEPEKGEPRPNNPTECGTGSVRGENENESEYDESESGENESERDERESGENERDEREPRENESEHDENDGEPDEHENEDGENEV